MAMLSALIAVGAIVSPTLAGTIPWQSRLAQSPDSGRVALSARRPFTTPVLKSDTVAKRNPMVVPALQNGNPWMHRTSVAGAASQMATPPVVAPDSIKDAALARSDAHALDSCPGDVNDKCAYDLNHRICAQLLDAEGKPLNWGDKSIQNLVPNTLGDISNSGASQCIDMSLTASLVQKVGCENVHIKCSATDVGYLTAMNWDAYGKLGLSLAPAVECLNMLCNSGVTAARADGGGAMMDFSDTGLLDNTASRDALTTRDSKTVERAYEQCEDVTKTFSKTFYIGTAFMAPSERKHAWAIYAWCRRLDDIVDSPQAQLNPQRLDKDLTEWNQRLDGIWNGKAKDMFDLAMADTVRAYPTLDKKPFRDMIDGMIMDVPGHAKGKDKYRTFEELYLYCYRVAGTVGMMMLPILGTADGVTEEQAKAPAEALGIALQLTNILRDVGEDLKRGRIYLPLDELKRFGLTEDDLYDQMTDGKVTEKYKSFMKFQIARARDYYVEAARGIPMLAPDARFAVRASLDLYERILDKIEKNGYDNFNKRAYTTGLEKLGILPGSWMQSKPEGTTLLGPAVAASGVAAGVAAAATAGASHLSLVSFTHDASVWTVVNFFMTLAGLTVGVAATVLALRRRRPLASAKPLLG